MAARAAGAGPGVTPGPLVDLDAVPPLLRGLAEASAVVRLPQLTRVPAPPPGVGRPAAVLVLVADDGPEPDVLLLRRSEELPSHPGQVAFPGGSVDPGDRDVVDAALREAVEEVGLDRDGVRPVAAFPELYLPPSRFIVTPVLAHWERPTAVRAVDPGETAAVARVPLSALVDPSNRFSVRHPSGWLGPAFALPGMLVWGFTAGLLGALLGLAGWAKPWDDTDVRDLDDAWRAVRESAPPPSPADGGDAVGVEST